MQNDLDFLSGRFLKNIPKEKYYLLKYFNTPIQEAFVKYYFTFGNFDNFCDHTGFSSELRWLKILEKRLVFIESLHKNAKMEMDLETLAIIESGDYPLVKNAK